MVEALNVFGLPLEPCCYEPMTGFMRDGFCQTISSDEGTHVVCCIITEEFLAYSKEAGNDLSTPQPVWDFPGLKQGDRWCLCATRWVEAHQAGMAPKVLLEACHEKMLDFISLDELVEFAFREKV